MKNSKTAERQSSTTAGCLAFAAKNLERQGQPLAPSEEAEP
jgi:hypothetical protein